MKIRNFAIAGIVFLLSYIMITVGVIMDHEWVRRFDYAFTALIQGQITESGADFVAVATDIADFPAVFVLTLAAVLTMLIKRMYVAGLWFGLTIYICASLLMDTMKAVIGRERPDLLVITMESSMSYPSGHSISSVMFYGFLGLILVLSVKKAWQKIAIGGAALLIIVFVMMSRVYLGVHYPTDTLGGFTFGMAGIFISISLYHLILPGMKRRLGHRNLHDRSPYIL